MMITCCIRIVFFHILLQYCCCCVVGMCGNMSAEPVGSVSPKITAGDDTKRMKIPMNTSTALLCQCQSFPVANFRCLAHFQFFSFDIFRNTGNSTKMCNHKQIHQSVSRCCCCCCNMLWTAGHPISMIRKNCIPQCLCHEKISFSLSFFTSLLVYW